MPIDPANWMRYLDPTRKVIESFIPASHDASAYTLYNPLDLVVHTVAGSDTQSANYTGQCTAGSRYFDMRVTTAWTDYNELVMKHGITTYESFSEVLDQLVSYANSHGTEFFFLDLDFEENLSMKVLAALTKAIDESRFTELHVKDDGTFNSNLTWGDLFKEKKQFIVMWQAGVNSGKAWAPSSDKIRKNYGDDNDKLQPPEIVKSLDKGLQDWVVGPDKDKLFLTQLINTPRKSPLTPPSILDKFAASDFNPWIMGKTSSTPLCVVKRDFVNESYNRAAIEHLISLNKFRDESPIMYQDKIRLRNARGLYVTVQMAPPAGQMCYLTVQEKATVDSEFLVRHFKYDPTWNLPFSGNFSADSNGANGCMRLIHEDRRAEGSVGNNYVLTVDKNQHFLYWGMSWGQADNDETFFFYDPNSWAFDGHVEDGSEVAIRTLGTAWLNVTSDKGFAGQIPATMYWTTVYNPLPTIPEPYIMSTGVLDPKVAEVFTVEKVLPPS